MSGLLALLDDVAAIAKVAAASVDDVFGQAAKASAKAAGAVIDDAAVTPKYVSGFEANRELPIIWRITKGSLKNKLVFLLPAGLLLSNFAPWLIAPLLMLGGAYLCFEGAEKIAHALGVGGKGHEDHPPGADEKVIKDPAKLEEQKAKGAIKTDFILGRDYDHRAVKPRGVKFLDGGRRFGRRRRDHHGRGLWLCRADRKDG